MKNKNPAKQYLLSLESVNSRTTMLSLLNRSVNIISPNATTDNFDWSLLSIETVLLVRESLSSKKMSPATMNTYLSALKGVAKECWRLKIIDIESYSLIKELKRSKGSRISKSRSLSLVELNALLDHCMEQEGVIALRDATVIALSYGAGLRRHEAANLQLRNYKKSKQTIHTIGKGNKERINSLNNRVLDILECWIGERGNKPGALFTRILKNGKITNKSITGQSVYNIIIRRYKEAGLSKLTPHDLRHSYATNLLDAGVDILIVQELLGHANLETTKIYDHRTDKKKIIAGKSLPL